MKYNLVPSGGIRDSKANLIYVLPASPEGFSYSIAYPECDAEDIIERKIRVRIFEGCSTDAAGDIEVELKKRLRIKHAKYSERLNNYFVGSIALLIIGIINWIIPDPLPLVDEILFTFGGGISAWKFWNERRTKLPLLASQNYRYNYEGGRPETETDVVLTSIFKSIKCKVDPITGGESVEGLDTIEIETLWITKYLNIQDLIRAGEYDNASLDELMKVLAKVFSLDRIHKLGIRKGKRPYRQLQNLMEDVISKTGVNADALAVYVQFYRAYLEYSGSKRLL